MRSHDGRVSMSNVSHKFLRSVVVAGIVGLANYRCQYPCEASKPGAKPYYKILCSYDWDFIQSDYTLEELEYVVEDILENEDEDEDEDEDLDVAIIDSDVAIILYHDDKDIRAYGCCCLRHLEIKMIKKAVELFVENREPKNT